MPMLVAVTNIGESLCLLRTGARCCIWRSCLSTVLDWLELGWCTESCAESSLDINAAWFWCGHDCTVADPSAAM